jgi:hypothetical protein
VFEAVWEEDVAVLGGFLQLFPMFVAWQCFIGKPGRWFGRDGANLGRECVLGQ